MKANKFLRLIVFITISSFVFTSCIEDKDFDAPTPLNQNEPDLSGFQKTTFKALVEAHQQAVANGNATVVFNQDIYIEGYVISSDEAGNFFEELIIQNHKDDSNPTEDPRLGFRMSINVSGLHQSFDFGRKVFIKLNGLTIGISNGVYVIAKGNGGAVEQIQEYELNDFLLRSPEVAEITPKKVLISELTETDENTYIQILNSQFNRGMLGVTYAGEASDQFDGFRTIESCDESLTIKLETSTFADFKSIVVNPNKGYINGVFGRDFRDEFNVLKINSLSDVVYNDTIRCDPIELDCGVVSTDGINILFEDMFETQTRLSPITGNGWTNYQEAGTETWEAYTDSGSNASQGISAKVGSFRSGDASTIAWLITPQIDLGVNASVTLSFETSNSFADSSNLELLFSNDWDETTVGIATATWGILPAAYIVQDSDSFAPWFESGIVDLSCGSGTIHIAFRYTGSGDDTADGTYELDNIKIASN